MGYEAVVQADTSTRPSSPPESHVTTSTHHILTQVHTHNYQVYSRNPRREDTLILCHGCVVFCCLTKLFFISYPFEHVQWKTSNPDTVGPEESVLIREVSLFQGLKGT